MNKDRLQTLLDEVKNNSTSEARYKASLEYAPPHASTTDQSYVFLRTVVASLWERRLLLRLVL